MFLRTHRERCAHQLAWGGICASLICRLVWCVEYARPLVAATLVWSTVRARQVTLASLGNKRVASMCSMSCVWSVIHV